MSNELLTQLAPLRPQLLCFLQRRWPEASPDELEDAVSGLWLDALLHPKKYEVLPEKDRFRYCKKVVDCNQRHRWRRQKSEVEFPEHLWQESATEHQLHAARAMRAFQKTAPVAAAATCKGRAGALTNAIRKVVEEGESVQAAANSYELPREYLFIALRHVRESMVAYAG